MLWLTVKGVGGKSFFRVVVLFLNFDFVSNYQSRFCARVDSIERVAARWGNFRVSVKGRLLLFPGSAQQASKKGGASCYDDVRD